MRETTVRNRSRRISDTVFRSCFAGGYLSHCSFEDRRAAAASKGHLIQVVCCSRSGFGRMVIANHDGKRQFSYASESLRCNIRAAALVAKIFREYFFAPVCRLQTCFNRHVWNGEPLNPVVLSL